MRGHRKNKWTKEEEEALLAGIAKHGAGKWMNILVDPQFAAQLVDRTNIHLKDKWRTMSRMSPIKEKLTTYTLQSTSISISPAKTSPLVVPGNLNVPNSSLISYEPSPNESRCNAMVFEAISTINDENGSDLSGILSFIEERHGVPQNFRKLLSNSLRLLVSQNKLEKVLNRYKISTTKATKPTQTLNTDSVSTTTKETQEIDSTVEAAANREAKRIKEFVEESNEWHEEPQNIREFVSEILKILISQGKLEKVLNHHKISEVEKKLFEVAPEVVATKLAESDNKSFIAAEAVKEAQEMQKLVEESDTMLQLCLEIHKECALGKEVLLR